MLDRPGSSPSSPNLQQIASSFRLTGWISFWIQLVLTVISSLTLIFATASTRNPAATSSNPSTGIGGALTVFGILVLIFNMYWSLARYVAIGKQLRGSGTVRPKRADALRVIRFGLTASLVGMLVALLGAAAITGLLAAKAFSQGIGGFVNTDPSRFIQPLDILVVQASINVILAQFAGIVASLWLLSRMSR